MSPPGRITVINGPNLGLIGTREPSIYGSGTEESLVGLLEERAAFHGLELEFLQMDIEGEIVSAIGSSAAGSVGLVINPAAYSHYSIAIMDAMKAFPGPVAEVHISQVFAREPFRRQLLTARAADVVIVGAGVRSYIHAMDIVVDMFRDRHS